MFGKTNIQMTPGFIIGWDSFKEYYLGRQPTLFPVAGPAVCVCGFCVGLCACKFQLVADLGQLLYLLGLR